MPGIVQEYDASKRRAKVLPALRTIMTDDESISKAPIVNVPVLTIITGGYLIHAPPRAGDTLMLFCSQRGIAEFKQTLKEADPDETGMFSIKDAVAFGGFGTSANVTLANDEELVLQNLDGSTHIRIGNNTIHIETDQTVSLTADDVQINGDLTVTGESTFQDDISVSGDIDVTGEVDGVNVSSHRHRGKPATTPTEYTSSPV